RSEDGRRPHRTSAAAGPPILPSNPAPMGDPGSCQERSSWRLYPVVHSIPARSRRPLGRARRMPIGSAARQLLPLPGVKRGRTMSISVDKRLLVLIAVRDSILQPPREVRSRPMLDVSPGAPVAARGRGASRGGRPAPTYPAADSLAPATAAETVSVPMRAAIGRRERGSTGRRARTALAVL